MITRVDIKYKLNADGEKMLPASTIECLMQEPFIVKAAGGKVKTNERQKRQDNH